MTNRDFKILSWLSFQDISALDLYFAIGCESTQKILNTLDDIEITGPFVAVSAIQGIFTNSPFDVEKPRYVLAAKDSDVVWLIWTFDNENKSR